MVKEQAPQPFYMGDDQSSSTVINHGHSEMEETLDNETFTQRLDQLILKFRTETM
jgi:hypothetical protein